MDKKLRFNEKAPNSKPSAIKLDDPRKVEFAIRDSEERHQTIIEGIEEDYIEVDLKGTTVFCNDSIHVKRTVEGPEILTALDKTDWNKAKAARLLGIDPSTFYRKIHKYNLSRPAEKV